MACRDEDQRREFARQGGLARWKADTPEAHQAIVTHLAQARWAGVSPADRRAQMQRVARAPRVRTAAALADPRPGR